jgi:hypothetical protein
MRENVVKLDQSDISLAVRNQLSDHEYEDLKSLCNHPKTVGHVLLDTNSEVVDCTNIDEGQIAAFANVFDICDALTGEFGQESHVSTVFESRDVEITCRRYAEVRAVVMQAKGNRKG